MNIDGLFDAHFLVGSQAIHWFSLLTMALTILFSVGVVLARWPIFAAMSLIGSLLTTAVLFVILAAPFLAVTQVMIYAGGILVLFIYILMLLGVQHSSWSRLKMIAISFVFLIGFSFGFLPIAKMLGFSGFKSLSNTAAVADDFGSIEAFGRLLMSDYAYPFELISVILIAVIAGVVYLTRHHHNTNQSPAAATTTARKAS